jgi:hypothetical protein
MIKWVSLLLCIAVVLLRERIGSFFCQNPHDPAASTPPNASRSDDDAECNAKRSLVIGYAYDLPLETLHYFVNPLQSFVSRRVDIVLFVKHDFKYDERKLAFLQPQNVFLIPIGMREVFSSD